MRDLELRRVRDSGVTGLEVSIGADSELHRVEGLRTGDLQRPGVRDLRVARLEVQSFARSELRAVGEQ
jgi:hypothetical protein